ncbi:uncharacterized protein MELLADRAFT_85566 [Melampsora larici-populina 98AG31]|uniref:Uncharacterized protein n=1 Tax=Melampsora larici-populina (strain 98AG31 / pathotype 3-4-7) TaxID=747676 RepID=F4RID4_MELLP|nr:uncharacterized protein MELLADRAFT_85566 [Melampsora larici-populina 98AG31]EGG07699.1 hypothetical protein MELLADRAFT_85566 [Melampsora larici-populina 98AG31]
MQQHTKKTLRDKQSVLKAKYNLFERNVTKFNNDFPDNPILCPPFEEMKRLSLQDGFWDIGQLTHPDQPWAVDKDTQEGIRAYLDKTHASDELHRISRECRHAINWAFKMQEKFETNKWIVDVVCSKLRIPTARLKKSKKVLQALYSRIKQDHARLMICWNCEMRDLLSCTKTYCQLTDQEENELGMRWSELAVMSKVAWAAGAEADIVEAVPLDEDEEAEMFLNLEDDDDRDETNDEDEGNEIIDEVNEIVGLADNEDVRRDGAEEGDEQDELGP